MKTAVVTGGSGFIGSHLCQVLLEEGSKVIAVDSLVTGSRANISGLLGNENFSFIEHDITVPLEIDSGVDRVYNLASPASPIDFPRIPLEILAVNSLGTKNMLELALEKKARLLEASTSEVYGQPLEHPQREAYFGNVNTIGERSCYDEGKRFAEALVSAYARAKKSDVRVARIFNTYGPRMRKNDGRVVPNFIMQALQNKPITVYGNGKQTRSFCFVSDLVSGLMKLMESNYTKPVNLGNPSETTVLELAEKVKEIAGSSSRIAFKELPEDDPTRRKPDISVALRELNWKPKVKLDSGLEKTIEWFKAGN
ncbi:MAG: SDR family oxidoreductase [Candidatus Diapherotrites archaeon]|uniref:SDR family oxidoreductase n=1 Tax=Candidatus Iainarchaeum sp. TaxID=3101447 RepID=A0A939C5A5_9ARCH|nr:SDR family oxidoreductase [Candidatus Diapherotrites archaeon]